MTSVASKILFNGGDTTAVYEWNAYIAYNDTAVIGAGETAWIVDQVKFNPLVTMQGVYNDPSHLGLYGTNDVTLSFQPGLPNNYFGFATLDVQGNATVRASGFASIGNAGANLHIEMSAGGSVTPIGSFGNGSLLDIYPTNGGTGVVTGAQVTIAEGGQVEIWTDVVGQNTFSEIGENGKYGPTNLTFGGGHSVSADTTVNLGHDNLTLWDTMTFMGAIHSNNAVGIKLGNFQASSYAVDTAAGTVDFYDATGGLEKALRLDGAVPQYVTHTATDIFLSSYNPPTASYGVPLAPHIG